MALQRGEGEYVATSHTGARKGRNPEQYSLIPIEAMDSIARLYAAGAAKYTKFHSLSDLQKMCVCGKEQANNATEYIKGHRYTCPVYRYKPHNADQAVLDGSHNWRGGMPWSWCYDSLMRHVTAFWAGEDLIPDDGSDDPTIGMPHLAAAAFHLLTLLTYMSDQPDHDDRP